MSKALPRFHRACARLAAILLLALIASRNLYYSSVDLPEGLDRILQRALVAQSFSALLAMWADVLLLVAAVLVGVPLLLFRRGWVFRREGPCWGVKPWLFTLAWLVLLVNHAFFEVNFFLALVCALSLPLILLGGRRLAVEAPVWALGLGLALALAPDAADRASVSAWALAAAALAWVWPRELSRADRLPLALLLVPPLQVSAAFIAKDLVLHEGTKVGDGMAYAYCESAERGEIFAMVPHCGTAPFETEDCRDAVVEVIDARAPARVASFRIFGDDYYGRIEEPVCLEDTIQVGMNRTVDRGERQLESALELEMEDPTKVRPHILGEAGGHRIAYDPIDDVLFYLGDDVPRVHRLDRKTGKMQRWEETGPASERIVSAAIHPGRRTLYAVSMGGPIRELRLDDLSLVRTFRHGAGTEIEVDPERDRLFVTGLFGLEVIDLETGRPLLRRRPGFLPRRPTLDPNNALAYLNVFGAGKLLVMDLESLRILGRVPIGVGGRYPYASLDGLWLFAGSEKAHYRFRISALDLDWGGAGVGGSTRARGSAVGRDPRP